MEGHVPDMVQEEGEQEEGERRWCDLNPELLHLVSLRLSAPDFSSFRRVCSSWRSIRNPVPRLLPPSVDFFRPGGTPILITVHGGLCSFFDPIHNAALQAYIPELADARIYAAGAGDWLLLSRREKEIFFFNLSTRVEVRLPDLDSLFIDMACFSGSPDMPGCIVVGTTGFSQYIRILKRGETAWRRRRLAHSYDVNCPPAMLGNTCYLLRIGGQAVGFNLGRSHRRNIYVDPPESRRDKWELLGAGIDQRFFADDEGKIWAVNVGSNEEPYVNVFGLDLKARTWRKVDGLENKMMFLSRGSCLLVDAGIRGTGNKIYLPKSRGGHGMFHSFATKKLHTFLDYFPRKRKRSKFIEDVETSASCAAWIQIPAGARKIETFTW